MIEGQIGKNFSREETIKAINSNMDAINAHVKRIMRDIHIEGLEKCTDEELGQIRAKAKQMLNNCEELWRVILYVR